MKKVFVVGGATVDRIIRLDKLPEPKSGTIYSKDFYDSVGSTGCGKALSLSRLGLDTTFHAMIGADRSGELIRDTMEKNGIHFIFDTDPKGTEEHVNLMDDNGGRISIFTKYATFEPELEYKNFEKDIVKCDYIVLNIINYVRNLIPIIQSFGKEIWCDIHDYDGSNLYHKDFIEAADYLFMSSDQMKDYRDFMQEQIMKGKKLVVCTHGKYGVSALPANGEFVEMPIIDAFERVDTNGAGDNFFSGFLYAHSRGYDLIKCLEFGSIAAGLCISSKEIVNPVLSGEYVEQAYVKFFSRQWTKIALE